MPRYIRWQVLLIVLGVVLVGILLAYLAANYTTVLRPGDGGTYVEGVVGSPHYLNPLLSSSQVDRDLGSLLFRGLTRMDERGEVEPDLATRWDVSLDGLVYTFYLRTNAYWHDGAPLTADDVLFTLGWLKSPDFPGPSDVGAQVWQAVTVEKLDRYKVRFTLAESYPYAPFLDYTTVGILPAHLLEGIPVASLPDAGFNMNPVGSGPFRLEQVEVEGEDVTSMVLEKFPRYYGASPHLDRVQFRFYQNHQDVWDAYEAGDLEGIAQVLPSDLPRALAFPDLSLFSAQMSEYGIVFLNLQNPALPFFQEPEVRQALLYALDRQQIVDSALSGQAVVAHSPLIPGTWAYDDQIPRYEHDPGKAGELLDEAGWPLVDGVRRRADQPLAFTLLTSNEPERIDVARMLADQWATVGVTVTVAISPSAQVRQALEQRDFEAILTYLSLPGDPDPYPFWHETQVEGGQNYGGFVHRRASEVLEQARVTVNREKRQGLYREFQEIFAQQVPALLLYVPVYTYGVSDRVHDVQIGPLMCPSDRFRSISDWWIVPRRVFVSAAESGE